MHKIEKRIASGKSRPLDKGAIIRDAQRKVGVREPIPRAIYEANVDRGITLEKGDPKIWNPGPFPKVKPSSFIPKSFESRSKIYGAAVKDIKKLKEKQGPGPVTHYDRSTADTRLSPKDFPELTTSGRRGKGQLVDTYTGKLTKARKLGSIRVKPGTKVITRVPLKQTPSGVFLEKVTKELNKIRKIADKNPEVMKFSKKLLRKMKK